VTYFLTSIVTGCSRDPLGRDRDETRDPEPRDRDETETFTNQSETRSRPRPHLPRRDRDQDPHLPRRDRDETPNRSRDSRETETSRPRSSPWYKRWPTKLYNYAIPMFTKKSWRENEGLRHAHCQTFWSSLFQLPFVHIFGRVHRPAKKVPLISCFCGCRMQLCIN